ncbi:hypothetical protein [Rhizobium arsenicireducens]
MKLSYGAIIVLAGEVLFHAGAKAASHEPATAPDAWTIEKCARYGRAFEALVKVFDEQGTTKDFIRGNRDFIAAGCSNGADICPTSERDIEFANALTLLAMNAGAASSFLPFVCRRSPTTHASP